MLAEIALFSQEGPLLNKQETAKFRKGEPFQEKGTLSPRYETHYRLTIQ